MTVFDRIKKLSNKKGKSLQAVAEENKSDRSHVVL